MKNPETVERAYSMASYPAEGREIMLNVRIATPPWDRVKNGWMDVNPGEIIELVGLVIYNNYV